MNNDSFLECVYKIRFVVRIICMHGKYCYFIIVLGLILALASCKNDTYYDGEMPMVTVSTDTLTFDTVFTTIGSATRSFKIYNEEQEDIKITIAKEQGDNSMFRLNVDGLPYEAGKEISINGKDSVYVFADVTVDPDAPLSVSPFLIEEYLTISSDKSSEQVLLRAFGQNANYIPNIKKKGIQSLLSCNFGDVTWDDPKPYVIYGILVIDECELKLPAGTDIYVHGGVVTRDSLLYNDGLIVVQSNGKITAEGTASSPVTFQGDRLEDTYKFRAGQWVGVLFNSLSKGNMLNHVRLKNSIIGIRVDSLAELDISNSIVSYTEGQGIIGYHARINMDNCVVHSTGAESVAFTFGGEYQLRHVTLHNDAGKKAAVSLNNFVCHDPADCATTLEINPLRASFTNCIISGTDQDEISMFDATEGMSSGAFEYTFKNCLVRVDALLDEQYPSFLIDDCSNCINYNGMDTLFADPVIGNLQLDTMSIAIDRGQFLSDMRTDILGNMRDQNPDLGAYEFQF